MWLWQLLVVLSGLNAAEHQAIVRSKFGKCEGQGELASDGLHCMCTIGIKCAGTNCSKSLSGSLARVSGYSIEHCQDCTCGGSSGVVAPRYEDRSQLPPSPPPTWNPTRSRPELQTGCGSKPCTWLTKERQFKPHPGWPDEIAPYRTTVIGDPRKCDPDSNTLAKVVASGTKLRIALGSDENPNYLAFWPSTADMWRSFGIVPTLALLSTKPEDEIHHLPFLRKYGDVMVLKPSDDPSIPFGHQAKLARSYLATKFPEDIVILGDIDYYIFDILSLRRTILNCARPDQLSTVGWDMYLKYLNLGQPAFQGRYPMYFSTGRGTTFAKFLNPSGLESFAEFIQSVKGTEVFDPLENIATPYGQFSDEALYRALLARAFSPALDDITHVVWVNRTVKGLPTPKRIDRASTQSIRAYSREMLGSFFDVFPNRPLANCATYKDRLAVVHEYLGIFNPTRDADMLQQCLTAGMKSKDWGARVDHGVDARTIQCIRNTPRPALRTIDFVDGGSECRVVTVPSFEQVNSASGFDSWAAESSAKSRFRRVLTSYCGGEAANKHAFTGKATLSECLQKCIELRCTCFDYKRLANSGPGPTVLGS